MALKIKVLIPVETSSRETLYKIYLSNLLVSKGFECYLGTKSNISFLIERFEGFIYFDKGFHRGVSESLYKRINKNNGVIVSLDEEGAIDFKDGSVLGVRYDSELFKAANTIFFWGKMQYENSKILDPKHSNCIISGHPRFQLLKKEYQFLYDRERKVISNKHGKFILINTNMGFGNNLRGDQFVKSNYGDRFNNLDGIIDNDKKKMRNIVGLCQKLSRYNVKIILRPHPEEDTTYYSESFVGMDNIVITKNYSAISWILAAEHMIHIDCTTGVEAFMLGRKSVAYVTEDLDKSLLTYLPLSFSYVVSDESEVIKHCLHSKLVESQDLMLDDYNLNQYFSFSADSFGIITEKVEDLSTTVSPGVNTISKLILYKREFIMFIRKVLLGGDRLINQKHIGFEWNEIRALHLLIKSSKNEFISNKCRRLLVGLYVFRK